MAYDLEEQEQLAQLKAWWQKYGNPIMSAVTVVLLGFAAYNGWRWYEREQAKTAAGIYGQLEQAIESRDAAKVQTIAAIDPGALRPHDLRGARGAAGRQGQRRHR